MKASATRHNPAGLLAALLSLLTCVAALDHRYSYDRSHNVAARSYLNASARARVQESFSHDKLNRLSRYGIDAPDHSADRTVEIATTPLATS